MEIIVKQSIAQVIGYKAFVRYGVSEESWRSWRTDQHIDLGDLSAKKLDDLEALLKRYEKVRGVGVLLHDITMWRKLISEDASKSRARTVRQFESVLKMYLKDTPGHRIYKRHAAGAMLAFYIDHIEYEPPSKNSYGRYSPAAVHMHLSYEEIGGEQTTTVSFGEDVRNVPVARVLAEEGFVPETPELRAEYEKTIARYLEIAPQIGKQYWAEGTAFNVDDRWDWQRGTTQLSRDGLPARVVIDVFKEKGEEDKDRKVYHHTYFWPNVQQSSTYDSETDEDSDPEELDEDSTLERPDIGIPIHPYLVVFDLAKHLRLKVHVDQLDEYIYDKKLSEKLVLPADQKALVKLLIETQGGAFDDIVRNKGGGAVILLTGAPGTGKTLTAEVYAESEQRALYSVQCAQLGTDPDELEEALMRVFDRGKRWNAVMLLDEADVYVRERGGSLDQNAIVGVFLRVLEYQPTTLFLTTNRPDDVDDAIASRCIARLDYTPPGAADARRIWRVLADTAKVKITDAVIKSIVAKNPGMTGRDIKNVLKLASLMNGSKAGITEDMVSYVQQFKPTGNGARHG